ncbi:hypothetical protein LEMLEM_LOCUS20876 [Lemmus lemmus]
MRPIIMPEVIIPLARRSSTWSWTGSENWQICAQDCRASSSSTASEGAQDLGSHLCSWNGFQWTMARSPNWNSPFTQPPRFPQPWWSPTTPS